MKKSLILLSLALTALSLLSSCITEDVPSDTPQGNFDALWETMDSHYCFFAEKREQYGVEWSEVRQKYAPAISAGMSDEALFQVFASMLAELRDGHVNLYAAHDVARYADWYDAYPVNYADTLLRAYLGRADEYRVGSSLRYRILEHNVGYVRCASFENAFGSGNISEMINYLALCDGLIVDVRNNGGGMLTSAQKLASVFLNEKTTVGYMRHKTGSAHDAFSAPQAITLQPFEGLRWQKPLVILTNRSTFSAANAFVGYLKGRPGVTVLGDRTGGGAGLPFSSELPCGWALRLSACPMYDVGMRCTEEGIDPDVNVQLTSEDYQRSRDTIIEAAIALLKK
ncbi:MAG: S41 family peptidase [Alloprevotella sp.]|nr:S41 family peptidase [Alloprevotella sp.]